MKTFNYAITMKKTRKPVTKQHYFDYLDKIKDLGDIGNVNFETTRGLHVHFILKTKTRLNYQKLRPTRRGWNAKAVPIYDERGWIQYVRKDRYQGNNDPEEDFTMPTRNLFRCCTDNKTVIRSPDSPIK